MNRGGVDQDEQVRVLLNAVLLQALKDAKGLLKAEKRAAMNWFRDEQSHHVFSFVPLCLSLGYEPEYILRRVLMVDERKNLQYIRSGDEEQETNRTAFADKTTRQDVVRCHSGERQPHLSVVRETGE